MTENLTQRKQKKEASLKLNLTHIKPMTAFDRFKAQVKINDVAQFRLAQYKARKKF